MHVHKNGESEYTVYHMAPDQALFFNQILLIFFLFLLENICCGYSSEAPRQGASDEYPQHMFSRRNKKNISLIPLLSGAMISEVFNL